MWIHVTWSYKTPSQFWQIALIPCAGPSRNRIRHWKWARNAAPIQVTNSNWAIKCSTNCAMEFWHQLFHPAFVINRSKTKSLSHMSCQLLPRNTMGIYYVLHDMLYLFNPRILPVRDWFYEALIMCKRVKTDFMSYRIYSLIRRAPTSPGRLSVFCLDPFIRRRKESR